MKLGMQVGLVPDHIVLDGDPAPLPQRGTAPPNFRASDVQNTPKKYFENTK